MMGEEGMGRCPECGLVLYQQVAQCPRCLTQLAPVPSQSAMVEKVYIPPPEKIPKEKMDVGRLATILFVIIVVVIIIVGLSYQFIIPRIEVSTITQYRESSGLSINVDTKIENKGTLEIEHLSLNVTVLNSTNGVVARGDHYVSSIAPHWSKSLDNIQFFGDQYEGYKVVIELSFESSGKSYSENYSHRSGNYMMSKWEDTFVKWGG
jgi:hypothetical protein